MTDKTPEGRKSDTMPLKDSTFSEKAREVYRETRVCSDCHPSHASCDVNHVHIEQALTQAEKEGFERGVREAVQVIEDICYSTRERLEATHQEILEDEGAQQAKRQVLSLLDPREKSRIEREGK